MVLKTLPLVLALVTGSAVAECYYRSTTVNDIKSRIQRQSEPVRELVRLDHRTTQCTVTFRLMIDNAWYTAQGRAQGDLNVPEPQICAQAQDTGRARLLQQIRGMETSMYQELVCTDQDIPKWKTVKKGDLVRESEVTPDPDHPGSMPHLGMECRRFLETIPWGEGLIQNRGIICKLQRGENGGRWKVIEKWEHFRG
jgi:hypothetical protein